MKTEVLFVQHPHLALTLFCVWYTILALPFIDNTTSIQSLYFEFKFSIVVQKIIHGHFCFRIYSTTPFSID